MPGMRASDLARERTAGLLRRRCDEGYLSLETFERRLADVFCARDVEQLAGLTADLPAIGVVGRFRQWQLNRRVIPAPVPSSGVRLPLELVGRRAVRLGRSRGCDVVLDDDSVSRTHALIQGTGAGWTLRDLGSSNGTWLGGVPVTGAARVVPGDLAVLGSCEVRFL
jgi:hypothetical protein